MPLGRGVYKKHKCPEKGCTEKFRTIVALGTHRAKFHHIKGAWAEAMSEARRKGLFFNPGNANGSRNRTPKPLSFEQRLKRIGQQKREDAVREYDEEIRRAKEALTNERQESHRSLDSIEDELQSGPPKSNGHGISALESLTWYAFGHIQSWLHQCAAGNGVSESSLAANVAELLHAQSSGEGFLGPQSGLSKLRENATRRIEG